MGRWRPPLPQSSPYITPAGYAGLQEELESLWIRRRDVVAALSAAAAEGDRSENAEYLYRKKELAGIDRRIRYLQKRLPALTVVRDTPDPSRVFFGAAVTLERDDGEEMRYRIVGADEIDTEQAWISVDSPMARALLRKRVDDEFAVRLPEGERSFVVVAVDYGG